MAFMTLKTIVFQSLKKNNTFKLRNSVPFIVCLLSSLDNYTLNVTNLMQRKVSEEIGVTQSNIF